MIDKLKYGVFLAIVYLAGSFVVDVLAAGAQNLWRALEPALGNFALAFEVWTTILHVLIEIGWAILFLYVGWNWSRDILRGDRQMQNRKSNEN